MKKRLKLVNIIFVILLVLGIVGCRTEIENGGTTTTTVTAQNTVKMVGVKLPDNGQITGVAVTETLPGSEAYWKGVFVEGRKVTLSAFEMAETETTYALWKKVYDWATSADRGQTSIRL